MDKRCALCGWSGLTDGTCPECGESAWVADVPEEADIAEHEPDEQAPPTKREPRTKS